MTPRRRIIAAILIGIGALIYGISPVDIIPELIAGPFGLVDDLAVFAGAAVAIWKLFNGRGDAKVDE